MCKIIAGIVSYNPNLDRLNENIVNVISQVDRVVLVDNNSNNIIDIEEKLASYSNVILIKNKKNIGIAAALNQIIHYAKDNEYTWALTLDQDSVCQDGLILEYRKYTNHEKIGMITCKILDRNFKLKDENITSNDYTCINECITSGCLTNVDACIESGGFDNAMFIDYVDFDMCASMRENGFRILKANFDGLLHELGNSNTKIFLGKEVVIYHHSDFRKYYMARNGIYYTRKHKASINSIKSYLRVFKRIIIVLIYEDQKIRKFCASIKGLRDGLIMKIGQVEE